MNRLITMTLCGLALAISVGILQAQEIRTFEGCVYNKATRKPVKNASVQVWTPGGSVTTAVTDEKGCFSGAGLGYSPEAGGFIEASATIRAHHYRQQYLLPPNLTANSGTDYHYDFYLDTMHR